MPEQKFVFDPASQGQQPKETPAAEITAAAIAKQEELQRMAIAGTDEIPVDELPTAEPKTQMYVAPKAPKLRVKIPSPDGEQSFEFEKGQLALPVALVPAFDKLIAKSTGLRPLVQKVDIEAAKRFVAEHERARRPAAAQGTFSTAQAMMQQKLDDINVKLKASGVGDDTYVDELGGASMAMQEHMPQDGKTLVVNPRAPKDAE